MLPQAAASRPRLTADCLSALFPFHVVFDPSLLVVSLGQSLTRICPHLQVGDRLGSSWILVSHRQPLHWDLLSSKPKAIFILCDRTTGLRLRGQMYMLPEQNLLAFLGSPVLHRGEVLPSSLSVADFAPHDCAPELHQSSLLHQSTLEEMRELASRLIEKRDVIIQTNLQIANQLREREQILRQYDCILDAAALGTFALNSVSNSLVVDSRLEAMLGFNAGEFDGNLQTLLTRLHHEDIQAVAGLATSLQLRAGAFNHEFRALVSGGGARWLRAQGQALADPEGQIHVFGTVSDITEHRKNEAALKQAQKLESVGRLAGGVAHDFNNMLTVVLGYSALSAEFLEAAHPVREFLSEIDKAARRSQSITAQLLGFSRQQVAAPVTSSLNDLVSELIPPMGRLIGEDIQFAFHPAAELWPIVIDHGQFNQILLNLTVNARDAMPQGGRLILETANLVLSAEHCAANPDACPGPNVMLAVSDSGVGIDAETLPRIFEPFFTTKTSTHVRGILVPRVAQFQVAKAGE